jgi:hypothetical protein
MLIGIRKASILSQKLFVIIVYQAPGDFAIRDALIGILCI